MRLRMGGAKNGELENRRMVASRCQPPAGLIDAEEEVGSFMGRLDRLPEQVLSALGLHALEFSAMNRCYSLAGCSACIVSEPESLTFVGIEAAVGQYGLDREGALETPAAVGDRLR